MRASDHFYVPSIGDNPSVIEIGGQYRKFTFLGSNLKTPIKTLNTVNSAMFEAPKKGKTGIIVLNISDAKSTELAFIIPVYWKDDKLTVDLENNWIADDINRAISASPREYIRALIDGEEYYTPHVHRLDEKQDRLKIVDPTLMCKYAVGDLSKDDFVSASIPETKGIRDNYGVTWELLLETDLKNCAEKAKNLIPSKKTDELIALMEKNTDLNSQVRKLEEKIAKYSKLLNLEERKFSITEKALIDIRRSINSSGYWWSKLAEVKKRLEEFRTQYNEKFVQQFND